MASVRRFTSTDSATRAKKQSHFNCTGLADGSSSDEEDMQRQLELPLLLKLDTHSLVNLFDSSGTPGSAIYASAMTRLQEGEEETIPLPPKSSKRKSGSAIPSRNDSTGSSSYSSSRQDSDAFSVHSRVSSRSSLSEDEDPATSYKDELKGLNVSPLRLRRTMDLHKPLPPGPPSEGTQRTSSGRSQPRSPAQDLFALSESTGIIIPSTKSKRERPDLETTPIAELSGSIPDLPTCRGTRLGMSVYQSMYKDRSKSTNAIDDLAVSPSLGGQEDEQSWSYDPSSNDILTTVRSDPRKIALPPNDKEVATEYVAFLLMSKLSGLADLQAVATTNKRFYASFKRNEAQLVSRVLYRSSRTAWEFRQTLSMHGQPDCFTLRDHRRGVATVTSIKSLLLKSCRSKLREDTVEALKGSNTSKRARINNALWRVWTFCLLFGRPDMRIGLLDAQIDWLNGGTPVRKMNPQSSFGIGNGSGLNAADFEDMSEIWQSLESLLSGFLENKSAARSMGLFDSCRIHSAESEEWYLNEWVHHILSLGLGAVLALSDCDFEHAKALNLTTWCPPPPGHTSHSFLKEAIAQAYQQKVVAEATARAERFSQGIGIDRIPSRPQISFREPQYKPVELPRAATMKVNTSVTSTVSTRPASDLILANEDTQIRPDCDPYSSISPRSQFFPATPSMDPSLFQTLSTDGPVSARSSATLFDYNTLSKSSLSLLTSPTTDETLTDEIIDPVDKAMLYLHNQLGYPEPSCRRALAMSDTGSGIDLQRAIEILSATSVAQHDTIAPLSRRAETMPAIAPTRRFGSRMSSAKDYTEGKFKRTMTLSRAPTRSGRRNSRYTITSLTTIKDDVDADADVSCNETPPTRSAEPAGLEAVRESSASPVPRRLSRKVSRMKRESVVKALKLLGIEDQNVIDNSESAMKAIKVLGIDDAGVLKRMSGSNVRSGSLSGATSEMEEPVLEEDEDEE